MTTFIRQYLLNAYTALPLLVCLLVASWAAQARPLGVTHRYSGEEMFRGLFFLEGRYAEAIPELKSMSLSYTAKLAKAADKKAKIHATRQRLIQTLLAEDKFVFDKFRAAVESGNPLIIKSKLEQTQQKLEELVAFQSKSRKSVETNQGNCLIILIVTSESAASLSMQVIAMVLSPEEITQTNSRLLTEQLVASMCRLSANPS
ncbi:hypothetical protein [Spirosoma montaniterrae]|uniref:DUF5667 domain-containing protein n=1 Tax=Spirosoma montaniterrae TaxID=1178516 RepID=A0A1P9WZB9_9BACT|nr:hypothetical protein [Spirosoma montaniterrae]AQG80668.1 hypothetical protein AWR27_15840 [Spirosoma montaniterrae]